MSWETPALLLLAPVLVLVLLWIEGRSVHPMSGVRKRVLLVLRSLLVLLAIAALAGPVMVKRSAQSSVGFVLDLSQSQGESGADGVLSAAAALRDGLPDEIESFVVLAGERAEWRSDKDGLIWGEELRLWQEEFGGETDYAAAVELAMGLFPPGSSRHLVMLGDGHETRGALLNLLPSLMNDSIRMDVLPVAGESLPDVRVQDLAVSRNRIRLGSTVELTARLGATHDSPAVAVLYENGVEVDQQAVLLEADVEKSLRFQVTPSAARLMRYRVVTRVEGEDVLPGNNEALAVVEVTGGLNLLAVTMDAAEMRPLSSMLQKECMQVDVVGPERMPSGIETLTGYDAVLIGAVPAHRLGERTMPLLKQYVEQLGGGLLMLGSDQSFGAGGYFETPIEEMLPVRLRSPDEEEKRSAAVALVIDRSGSMAGEKLEMAKSASVATAEVLARNDFLGVYAFDSEGKTVVPMTRLTSRAAVAGQISTLAAGGGTNLEPALDLAREALLTAKARVKHMIILTDGQTTGGGYEALASNCRAEGMTISTIAIGDGSHVGLLQAIAAAGGGQSYSTTDVGGIARIFTQDTLMHTGQMIREEPFDAMWTESHPMLEGFQEWSPPPLLGFVKTLRKASAQMPLATSSGDPLLAQWRYGLGKVTAFTSDASERWASLWMARWDGVGRFWSQVIRDTARPPQGRRIDLHAAPDGQVMRLRADVVNEQGDWDNRVEVNAEVLFVSANELDAPLRSVASLELPQVAAGGYSAELEVGDPGVYLVRVQAGGELASTAFVTPVSEEVPVGQADSGYLEQVAALGGGRVLRDPSAALELQQSGTEVYQDLRPMLLQIFLILFLLDVGCRRWEQLQGMAEALRKAVLRRPA